MVRSQIVVTSALHVLLVGRRAHRGTSRSSARSLSSSSTVASATGSGPSGARPAVRSERIISASGSTNDCAVGVPHLADGGWSPGASSIARNRCSMAGATLEQARIIVASMRTSGVPSVDVRVGETANDLVVQLLHQGGHRGGLVLEVEVERRAGDTCPAGDVGDVDRVEAAVLQSAGRGPRAVRSAAGRPLRRPAVGARLCVTRTPGLGARRPAGSSLRADVVLVDEVVELVGVPRTVEHVAHVALLVGVDHPLHLGDRRRHVVAHGVGRDQPRLALDEREQRRRGLGEAGEDQVVDARA